MNVSERIITIVNQIEYRALADIGTDHGYIPIQACKTLKVDKAIACDINEAPLSNAKLNISSHDMTDNIETRLGSGLTSLKKDEVQTCTIAGMGGDLIINILEDSKEITQNLSQLILQPQSKIEKVRRYIHSIGFKITNESFINEDGKYYTVINCKRGEEKSYTLSEYALGKILIEKKESLFVEYIKKEKSKLEVIVNNIKQNNSDSKKIEELNMYIKIYNQLLLKY